MNKFGAILLLDGDYGPLTRVAVRETCIALNRPPSDEADDDIQQAIAAHPDPFPALTAAGVTFIARAAFEADWRGRIPEAAIERLARVLGRRGSEEALASVRAIEIPLPVALAVFLDRTLPEFVADTRAAFPQFGSCPRRVEPRSSASSTTAARF